MLNDRKTWNDFFAVELNEYQKLNPVEGKRLSNELFFMAFA